MFRILILVLLAITLGVTLAFLGHFQKYKEVRELFERRPQTFPASMTNPFSMSREDASSATSFSQSEPGKSEGIAKDSSTSPGSSEIATKTGNPETPGTTVGSNFPLTRPSANVLSPVPPEKAPKVEVVGTASHNFGTMKRQTKKSHTFVLKNVGQQTLDLKVGGSTCKCTIGTLDKSKLNPGEETGVTLEWSAEVAAREFAQSAEIMTNDPEKPVVKLSVDGIIVDNIVFASETLDFGNFSTNEQQVRSIKLYSFVKEPMEIKTLTWSNSDTEKWVRLTHRPSKFEGKDDVSFREAVSVIDVIMEILPGYPQGKVSGMIFATTNLNEKDAVECAVKGNGTGDISLVGGKNFDINKSLLDLGEVKQAEGKVAKIFVSVRGENRKDTKLSLVSIRPEDAFKLSISEPTERGEVIRYTLTIEVPKNGPLTNQPGTAAGNFGKIVLKSTSKFEQEIPIYFRLVVNAE
jgi:hypothetical protein